MFTDGVPVSFRTPLPNGDAVAASKLTPLPVFHHAMDCSLPFCTKFVGDALSPASSWMSSMLLRSTPGIVTACPLEFMRIGSMYESASQSLTM